MSPCEKPTPMAIPSGRLCRAMAKTNSQTRPQRSNPGPQGPPLSCSCGVNASRPSISSTPSAMPSTTTAGAGALAAEDGRAGLQAGDQQREGAGGEHHAGRHAEHAVFDPLRNVAQEQRRRGAQGGGGETGGAADQRKAQHRRRLARGDLQQALPEQRDDGQGGEAQAQGGQHVAARMGAQRIEPA